MDDLSLAGGEHAVDLVLGIQAAGGVLLVLPDDLHVLADVADVQVGSDGLGNSGGNNSAIVGVDSDLQLAVLQGGEDLAVAIEHTAADVGVIGLLQQSGGGALLVAVADVGAGDGHIGVVLHNVVLHAVPDQLSGGVPADGQVHGHAVQILVQRGLAVPDSQGVGVDGPVGAGELIGTGLVTQGGQHHLGSLGAGHVAVGIEGAVAAAIDVLHVRAVLDELLSPVALGVAVGGGGLDAEGGGHAAVDGGGDHLGHLGTGDQTLGIEGAGVLAVDDVQGHHGVDSFGVDDLVSIGEVGSRGSHDHHAAQHGPGQGQAEQTLQVLHGIFLLKSIRTRGIIPCHCAEQATR